jgi:AcrR family transcriptional regulator
MAAITRTPRSRWIEEGLRALAAGGPDAVWVEALAQALGVTKGGFYGHFADRNALLAEMLDSCERMSTDEVLERVERKGGDVRARLRLAGALTFSSELLPIDLAIRDWSRRDQAVAERLRRVDNRRMDYLCLLFGAICSDQDEVEARSMGGSGSVLLDLVAGYSWLAEALPASAGRGLRSGVAAEGRTASGPSQAR